MHRAASFILLLTAMALACLPAAVAAQSENAAGPIQYLPGVAGDYFAIDSVAADHRYHVFIRYPESYGEAPERTYPVVYLLDGDTLFPMLAPKGPPQG